MTSLDTSKYILVLSDNHLFQTRWPKIPQVQAFMKCAPLLYPLLSFMEVPDGAVSVRHVVTHKTHWPSTLFIRNMSIFSTAKTARNASSQIISFLFDGFCKSCPWMYSHSFLTTWGRDNFSTPTTTESGSLSIPKVRNKVEPKTTVQSPQCEFLCKAPSCTTASFLLLSFNVITIVFRIHGC